MPRSGLDGPNDRVMAACPSCELTMCSGVRTKRAVSLSRLQHGKEPLPTLPRAPHQQAAQAALSSNQPPRTGMTATKRITSSVEMSRAAISFQPVPGW